MGEVVRQWEAATEPAADAGARVVVMRTASCSTAAAAR